MRSTSRSHGQGGLSKGWGVEAGGGGGDAATRFLGAGVEVRGKLMGAVKVEGARGEAMCQAALAALRARLKAAAQHKQRVRVAIRLTGITVLDDKTGACPFCPQLGTGLKRLID